MQGFQRFGEDLLVVFEPQEIWVLSGLLDQLTELLTDPDLGGWVENPPSPCAEDDVLGRLEWEMQCGHEVNEECLQDPVLKRLFPDAYLNDQVAAHEFRRFTQAAQRDAKVDNAIIVSNDLREANESGRCWISCENVEIWLKTLTALRLAIAARLGVASAQETDLLAELPETDPRAWAGSVYEWVGWLQESLLAALEDD